MAEALRKPMPQLQVRRTKAPGSDLIASESAVLGASLRIKHQPKKGRTLIVVAGIVPNMGLRVALAVVFLLPLVILDLVAHQGVAARIAETLRKAPELRGPTCLTGEAERP